MSWCRPKRETLLPACLMALQRAVHAVSIPVRILVVADSCTDHTAVVARACGASVIGIRARNVGAARAAGMAELLRLTASRDPAAIWLATTDAKPSCRPAGGGSSVRRPGLGCRPRDRRSRRLGRASAARASRVRCPVRVRFRAAPACARRQPRHPGVCIPGGRRVQAASDRRGPRPARGRDRGGLPGRPRQRHQRSDIRPPPGAGPPRVQPPAPDAGPVAEWGG